MLRIISPTQEKLLAKHANPWQKIRVVWGKILWSNENTGWYRHIHNTNNDCHSRVSKQNTNSKYDFAFSLQLENISVKFHQLSSN